MEVIKFTDIDGIRVGNAENYQAGTGCTVIICEKGGSCGVDVRGGAPGTRETDLLDPVNLVDKVHSILLAGGSAFGLDAAAGIMEYLEGKKIGFDVGMTTVPIVVGAVLFDLGCGDYKVRPDKRMGLEACINSEKNELREGNLGAGTGATVGKLKGNRFAMKGGLGSYALKIGDLMVGAIVAVNSLGDIIDPKNGGIIAGALSDDLKSFEGSEKILLSMLNKDKNLFSGNTTIGAIVTNANLNKAQATKVASMGHDALARTMRPSHTMQDGDTLFCLSTGDIESDVNIIGTLGAMAMEEAILRAIKNAETSYGYKSYKELKEEI